MGFCNAKAVTPQQLAVYDAGLDWLGENTIRQVVVWAFAMLKAEAPHCILTRTWGWAFS